MSSDGIENRRRALGWLTGGGVVAAVSMIANRVWGDEQKVAIAKLPKVVMDAAEGSLPKATWHSAIKVLDGTKVAYELDGSDGRDRDMTVLITAAGKVVEVETELKIPANVPATVLSAVKTRWPRFTPTETHQIRQGKDLRGPKDGDFVYDMRGTIVKGREIQIQVSADGEILESTVEVPLEKVPALVTGALAKARPKFEIGTAYTLHEGGKLIGYHFEGKGAKGRDRTISVTPDGKQVEVVE